MEFTRRNILALGSGAFAAASFAGMPAFASKTDDAIAAFTGGASVTEGAAKATKKKNELFITKYPRLGVFVQELLG